MLRDLLESLFNIGDPALGHLEQGLGVDANAGGLAVVGQEVALLLHERPRAQGLEDGNDALPELGEVGGLGW